MFDPQTSGGLLLLVPEANRDAVLAELPHARAIGVARPAGEHPIVVAEVPAPARAEGRSLPPAAPPC